MLEHGLPVRHAHRVEPTQDVGLTEVDDEVSDLHAAGAFARAFNVGRNGWRLDPWNGDGAHPYPFTGGRRSTNVVDLWLHDIESLEAVAQDESTKLLCLRMAAMSKAGTLEPFIATLHRDDELDEGTKGTIAEIARDEQFLLAVEDYVRRTRYVH